MATEKERQEFIARFCAEYSQKTAPNKVPCAGYTSSVYTLNECIEAARALLRHARTHGRLAVEECNGPTWGAGFYSSTQRYQTEQREKRETDLATKQERVEKRIREICAGFNLPVTLGGDPRGYTVRVKLPSGASNTWGGSADGWGVPQ